jgi:hypothetical protein
MKAVILIAIMAICSCSPNIQAKQDRLKRKVEGKKPKEEKQNLLPLLGIGLVGYYILNTLRED